MSSLIDTTTAYKSIEGQTVVYYALVGLLIVVVASAGILAAVPPISRDALTHHLAVPKLYLEHGGIYEIPSIDFSYYPMNLDLLYLIPLYFGNDIIPKYIHFMFALLTAGLIYHYLAKRLGAIWGLLGALFFLSLPVIVKLSITVYVDLGLIFFSSAALFTLIRWTESRFRLKFLILAAVCCGLALGVKYNGLIVLFILTLFVPYIYIVESKNSGIRAVLKKKEATTIHQMKAIGYCLLFFGIAVVIFSPWLLRNYAWKGNPVYPLYNSFFSRLNASAGDIQKVKIPGDSAELANVSPKKSPTHWGPLAIRKVIYEESWWEIALVPIRIFLQGQDDNPRFFDGKLNPLLLLLPILAFIPFRSGSVALGDDKKILAAFMVLFILYAFLQIDMRIRYVAPIIPPAVILTVYGLHRLAAAIAERWKYASNWLTPGIMLVLATIFLTYNGIYIFRQFEYVKPFTYLSGQASRAEYIVKYRPEYTVIQYINHNLPQSSKIMALFLGNRGYYFNREVMFGDNLFKKIVKQGDSPSIIRDRLRQMGLTYLVIRYDLFNHWAKSQFNNDEKRRLQRFFAEFVTPLLSHSGYGLYALKNT